MKTILIVEDDNLVRAALARALESNTDLEIHEAVDGKEGLEAALKHHPDLIVADLHMPVMEGQDMLKKLREDAWGKTAKVIILTADEGTATLNEALESGVTTYLVKSNLSLDELVASITGSLE